MFIERGFEGTTISEIERRVGLAVGTGSLNYHFKSKDELLRAAVEREIAVRMAEVQAQQAATSWPTDQRAQMVLALKMTLRHIRRFEPLRRLLQAEGERVPDLRTTVITALHGTEALTWTREPERLTAIAALAGYSLFSNLANGPFESVSEDDFIATLASWLPLRRPPGIDQATYEAISDEASDSSSRRRATSRGDT